MTPIELKLSFPSVFVIRGKTSILVGAATNEYITGLSPGRRLIAISYLLNILIKSKRCCIKLGRSSIWINYNISICAGIS